MKSQVAQQTDRNSVDYIGQRVESEKDNSSSEKVKFMGRLFCLIGKLEDAEKSRTPAPALNLDLDLAAVGVISSSSSSKSKSKSGKRNFVKSILTKIFRFHKNHQENRQEIEIEAEEVVERMLLDDVVVDAEVIRGGEGGKNRNGNGGLNLSTTDGNAFKFHNLLHKNKNEVWDQVNSEIKSGNRNHSNNLLYSKIMETMDNPQHQHQNQQKEQQQQQQQQQQQNCLAPTTGHGMVKSKSQKSSSDFLDMSTNSSVSFKHEMDEASRERIDFEDDEDDSDVQPKLFPEKQQLKSQVGSDQIDLERLQLTPTTVSAVRKNDPLPPPPLPIVSISMSLTDSRGNLLAPNQTKPVPDIPGDQVPGAAAEEQSEKRDSVYSDLKRRITLAKSWKLNRQPSIKRRTSPGPSSPTSNADPSPSPPLPLVPTSSVAPAADSSLSSTPSSTSGAAVPLIQTENVDVVVVSSETGADLSTRVLAASSETDTPQTTTTNQPQTTSANGTSTLLSAEKRKKYVEVRKYILGELLETEKNYVNNLDIVLKKFKLPLVTAAQGDRQGVFGTQATLNASSAAGSSHNIAVASSHAEITSSSSSKMSVERSLSGGSTYGSLPKGAIIPLVDIKIIFAYINDLCEFNREFSSDLETVVSRWERSEKIWDLQAAGEKPPLFSPPEDQPMSIGQLFLSNARNWNVYLKFVDNYSSAKEAIRRSEESSPAYRQFIQDCLKSKECQRQGIADFLILPIQRVTRYVLLLQDLKKHTPADHPDYVNILSGLDDMRKLANTVNEVKRKEEEMTRMFYVIRTIEDCPPTIISAQRRVLFETDGVDVTRDNVHLAVQALRSNSGGVAIVPSPSANTGSGGGGSSSFGADGYSTLMRLYLFSDIFMVAKQKKRKENSKFRIGGMSSDSAKKDKFCLYRMCWLSDVEFQDVPDDQITSSSSGNGSKKGQNGGGGSQTKKHLIKVIIHNSDGGNPSIRKKFWTELATANTAASSTSAIGPRGSSKIIKGSSSSSAPNSPSFKLLTTSEETPNPPLSLQPSAIPAGGSGEYGSPESSLASHLPTVESIEQIARERLSIASSVSDASTNSHQRPPRTSSTHVSPSGSSAGGAAVSLQRASTISTRSPTPRFSSLKTSSTVTATLGTSNEDHATGGGADSLSSSRQSIDSQDSQYSTSSGTNTRHTIDGSAVPNLSVSLERKSSLSLSHHSNGGANGAGGPMGSQTFSFANAHTLAQRIIETFIVEFPDKKQKNEVLLVVEKLALEKRIRSSSDAN